MRVSLVSCLSGLSFLSTVVTAIAPPLDLPQDAQVLEERQSGYFPITGVQTGGVQPRLEVRQMYNTQPYQWNLYLLGLQKLKAVDQSGKFSYYQLAGIHGVPNIPWDGVNPNPSAGNGVGYCTHSSVLFPSWHRPYLALFEQSLYTQVQAVANSFPAGTARTTYLAAAKTFRIPYWDWAAAPASGQPTYPYLFSAKYVNVVAPSGKQTILNPLFRYDFHPLSASDMIYEPWAHWGTTKRWPPTNASDQSAPSRDDIAQAAVENQRLNLRDGLFNMFTLCQNYLEMSNDASSSSSPGCSNSLEGLHNQIHYLVGGDLGGHMAWLWWSSFDPVFWLHHANVDRLFAMWQVIYPNSYGAAQVAQGDTYTIAQGSWQDANSPLTPFHSTSSGGFWTTNSVRNTQVFGYTYPETKNSSSASTVMGYVNALYGRNANATAGSTPVKRDLSEKLVNPKTGKKLQYICNIAAQRFALNGTFVVYLFMGHPSSEDASSYLFDPNLIGSVSFFANPGMTMNKLVTTGSIPLTRALTAQIAGGLLTSLRKRDVIPFLRSGLQWRVADGSRHAIPNQQVPGLEVSVVTSEFRSPTSTNSFPIYDEFETLPAITDSKVGGLNHGAKSVCSSN